MTSDADGDEALEPATLSALMDDGDVGAVAPGAMVRPGPMPAPGPGPGRFCPNGDCTRAPLAFWKLDDCNPLSTELADSAFSSPIQHPAFRAVSVACTAGVSGQAVKLSGDDDIVYAPDQPDFVFSGGLSVAAWINPDRVTGTQSLVRKRLDGTSSFVLAIDGRRLVFALRLTNGRIAAIAAPIQARRFTHVAATYDGREAILYVDGAAAARTRIVGSIAPGVGPIFVGNDASSRQFQGVVDEIWLNTLAAPADTIRELTCIRRTPLVALSPSTTPPQVAGASVTFDLSVTNQNSATCPVDRFDFATSLPFSLTSNAGFGVVSAGPGQTAHASIDVRSRRDATVGAYPFQVFVANEAAFQTQATAQATYVVGTGPVACEGAPVFPGEIIGPSFGAAGGSFAFAAPGLAAPTVNAVLNPSGGVQSLHVSVNPGVPADPTNTFLGFGAGFANPPCADAGAFTGVSFTLSGDLGTCQATFSVIVSQDNAVANGPFGTCTAADCVSPVSGPITIGANFVRFADMTGGRPLATVDASALNGVQWTLTAPSDGVTAPCVANLTVTDVRFANGLTPPPPPPSNLSYTFMRSAEGWHLNTFMDARATNLAVNVPPGASPPVLVFNPMDGDPARGSIVVTAPFTDFNQYVDAIVDVQPAADLTGRTLQARVKLVSGSFPSGGLQLHASSGPSFVFVGNFLGADNFPLGQWVPVTLDLAALAPPDFDPASVVQVGVQFSSGIATGGPFDGSAGGAVFQIDTVTD